MNPFRVESIRLGRLCRPSRPFALLLLGGIIACHFRPAASPGARAEDSQPQATPEAGDRLREGTRLDGELGTFKATGDRWTFFAAGAPRRFGVLENLALERVERTIRENSQAVEWSVSGVITEHQGMNYLLVSRAVLKTRLRQP